MSRFLSGLARSLAGRRHKWFLLGAWAVLLAVALPFAAKIGTVTKNEATSTMPRTAQSTQVAVQAKKFGSNQTVPALIVYSRDGGITRADRARVEQDRAALARFSASGKISGPEAAKDGDALLLTVQLLDKGENVPERTKAIRAELAGKDDAGLHVKVAGAAGQVTDHVAVYDDLDSNLLILSAIIVAVLLLLTYRSPFLWLLPLIAVGVASRVATAVAYWFAQNLDLPVSGPSQGVMTVLVFGVGTDYALLLVARYREELHRHADRHKAMAEALRRSGPAVVASAATVAVAMLCLLFADLNSSRGLGALGAIGVLSALVVMMTLLPALLVVVGRWAFWPLIPREGTEPRSARGVWTRISSFLAKRARLVWTVSAAVIAALGFGLLGLHVGLTPAQQLRHTPESAIGQDIIGAHYPAGAPAPTTVVAPSASANRVAAVLAGTPGVASVPRTEMSLDGTLAKISVVLADPADSDRAGQTVDRLRDALATQTPNSGANVGGPTATALDKLRAGSADQRLVIPLALIVIGGILMLLLRSIVAPLLLLVTVVLSYLAALGVSHLLFKNVFGFAGVDESWTLMGFVFLVALGVDYNIFLMHRIKEEVGVIGHRRGVLAGLTSTGGVITNAGVILAATFAVIATLPSVSLAEAGVVVSVGVLLDTFVVRSLLVPALALDVGKRLWWPNRPWPSTPLAAPPRRRQVVTHADD
ncbi:MMPL family transporter [Amycolatopsis sp. VS8301801F10]|uniref:MMPL family transporter n=1 Tax=Amycolatopsis sp. VS8301801F10 TaxID=2652442 RepID=UPI0038FC0113